MILSMLVCSHSIWTTLALPTTTGYPIDVSIVVNENNELCNNGSWNDIKGQWSYNSTDCSIRNTNAKLGNSVWFGSADGTKPLSQYCHESFRMSLMLAVHSGDGKAGLLFRTGKVSTVWNEGPTYFVRIKASNNKISIKSFDNGVWDHGTFPVDSIQLNTTYNLTLVARANLYDVYLDGDLVVRDHNLTEYTNYSHLGIGLYSHMTNSSFYSLMYEPVTPEPATNSTSMPTLLPTTNQPTWFPTSTTDSTLNFTVENMTLMATKHDSESKLVETQFDSTILLITLLSAVLLASALFGAVAFCQVHRRRPGTDYPNYVSPFKFGFNVADLYTDVIWTLTLVFEQSEYAVCAVLFTLGSYAVSLIIGISFVTKWKATRGSKSHLSGYAEKYGALLLFGSVIAGFYSAVELCTSKLYHIGLFSLHITRSERQHIRTMRIVNVVLLENLPLLILQILYLSTDSSTEKSIDLTMMTISFSSLSILSGLSNIITIFCSRLISRQNHADSSNQTMYLEFALKQKEPGSIKAYHIHSQFLIQKATALALCLTEHQVVIHKVQNMSNGILIFAKLKQLNEQQFNELKVELQLDENEKRVSLKMECIKQLRFQNPENVTLNDLKLMSNDTIISRLIMLGKGQNSSECVPETSVECV